MMSTTATSMYAPYARRNWLEIGKATRVADR